MWFLAISLPLGQTATGPYLLQEPVEGENLRARCEREPFKVQRITTVDLDLIVVAGVSQPPSANDRANAAQLEVATMDRLHECFLFDSNTIRRRVDGRQKR